MRKLRITFCALAILTALAVNAAAQDRPEAGASADPPAPMDVGDIWHKVRHQELNGADELEAHQRSVVFAPTIGSKPTTGLNGGVAWNGAFLRGDPSSTQISTLTGSVRVSQKRQTMVNARLAVFSDDDRWFFQGDNRLWWTSQDTYNLGGSAPAASAENLKFDFFRLYETVYRAVAPGVFVGVGLNFNSHADVVMNGADVAAFNSSAYADYSAKHGFSTDRQDSVGTAVSLRYDTRDNGINAQRGWLASATYRTFFDGLLSGDSTWQQVNLDVRTYKNLTRDGRHRIAFWFLGDLVTGGTAPYFDLPNNGADGRSARGYAEGRYRGEHLLYGEAEYRGTITGNGLLGFVAFANVTTVGSEESGDTLFGTYAPAAGGGLRMLLNKRSHTNLCADYGWGKDGSRGFYLAIQEAF